AVDFSGIDGIDRVHDFGRLQEVRLKPGTDPQQVLAGLITRNRLTRFEMASPSLEDIFIRIAKPQRNDQNE
ncbi:MAG: DUF4162 domain-containing protein, partial [Bacteroidales bacterium]|nr:DUF4162 domain-containing protein [Bacteroidales bacterium]